MRNLTKILMAVVTVAGLGGLAQAEPPRQQAPENTTNTNPTAEPGVVRPTDSMTSHPLGDDLADMPRARANRDEKFAKTAGQAGIAEVQLAQLGVQKAQAPSVKEMAQRMVADHTKANEELSRIASDKHLQLPGKPTKADRKTYDRLSRMKSGPAFDHAFAVEMLKAHNQAIALFDKEAKAGKDNDLKSFASRTLPTLRMHKQMAQAAVSGRRRTM